MGQQSWALGSEGRSLMLWLQLEKITEEENDDAKWSSRWTWTPVESGRGEL
ncbi:hypothetical protein I79_016204 [Cricetulus griseus]|uniref:Uncharacterized protein n=1 Tax=Cricetulus griseus TaxID=10029 RepID=G3HYR3_CRIGR|nr:hypothetical protein I79_016204 [Cricetulus griseus]